MKYASLADRIERCISPPNSNGCRLWLKGIAPDGYGHLKVAGKSTRAHKMAYTAFVGPIPPGMCVCHHCDVPACCEPSHLFLGTHSDNMRDAQTKGRLKLPTGGGWPPKPGMANPSVKLTDEQVRSIRADMRAHRTIGAAYGIGKSQVGRIKSRLKWAHLP